MNDSRTVLEWCQCCAKGRMILAPLLHTSLVVLILLILLESDLRFHCKLLIKGFHCKLLISSSVSLVLVSCCFSWWRIRCRRHDSNGSLTVTLTATGTNLRDSSVSCVPLINWFVLFLHGAECRKLWYIWPACISLHICHLGVWQTDGVCSNNDVIILTEGVLLHLHLS